MKTRRVRKIIRKILLSLLAAIAGTVLLLVLLVNVTPDPFVWFMRHSGILGGAAALPDGVAAAASQVNLQKDLLYPSAYPGGTMDVYSPVGADGPRPTLFWMHGGAYISGDKDDVEPLAMGLAQNGYTVVSLNYAVAPETTYPAPVVQLGEACRYVCGHPAEFPAVDPDNIAFGGDSAGAQIASQFVALQTDPALAEEAQSSPVVTASSIRAVVLYCGLYDLASFQQADNGAARFIVQQLGWAYFGDKDWMNGKDAAQSSTYDYVTKEYPPTFLTDGNWESFEEQGQALYQKLRSLDVPADALFYPAEDVALPHEYQFRYDKYGRQADECFSRTLRFLDTYMK